MKDKIFDRGYMNFEAVIVSGIGVLRQISLDISSVVLHKETTCCGSEY